MIASRFSLYYFYKNSINNILVLSKCVVPQRHTSYFPWDHVFEERLSPGAGTAHVFWEFKLWSLPQISWRSFSAPMRVMDGAPPCAPCATALQSDGSCKAAHGPGPLLGGVKGGISTGFCSPKNCHSDYSETNFSPLKPLGKSFI